jgi:hypothetical protein
MRSNWFGTVTGYEKQAEAQNPAAGSPAPASRAFPALLGSVRAPVASRYSTTLAAPFGEGSPCQGQFKTFLAMPGGCGSSQAGTLCPVLAGLELVGFTRIFARAAREPIQAGSHAPVGRVCRNDMFSAHPSNTFAIGPSLGGFSAVPRLHQRPRVPGTLAPPETVQI